MNQLTDAKKWFIDMINNMSAEKFVDWCDDYVPELTDEFMCIRCKKINGRCVQDEMVNCPYINFKEYFFAEDEEKYFKSKIGDKSDDD